MPLSAATVPAVRIRIGTASDADLASRRKTMNSPELGIAATSQRVRIRIVRRRAATGQFSGECFCGKVRLHARATGIAFACRFRKCRQVLEQPVEATAGIEPA